MPYFTRFQLILGVGFLVVLFSIPLTFALVKRTQTINSQAEAIKPVTLPKKVAPTPVTKLRKVPANSPLSDLKKLLESTNSGSEATDSASLTPTPTINLTFGPILNIKVNFEGRPAQKQNSKAFVGITQGTATTKPQYVLTFSIDFPASGVFSGLSLAGLSPGSTYTAYIKGSGQIDVASTFVMGPTETLLNNNSAILLPSGDLNEDNTVNSADYTIIKSLYGSIPSSLNWNERADFNGDGLINGLDISYILKNFGKTGASSIWYSTPAPATPSAQLRVTPAMGGPASPDNSQGGPSGGDITQTEVKPGGGYWLWVPPAGGR